MKRTRRILLCLVLVGILSANVTAVLKRQSIGDWLVLRDYSAPAAIASLASQDTMTESAKRLFYVNRPSLEDKAGFNSHCSSKSEHSMVLGCFHGDRLGIYIYDVKDTRLEGVKQVTAAHEMLHQAYSRLSDTERQRIDGLIAAFAETGDYDQRIKDKLQLYKESDPGSVPNEMHSIFATEVRDLPSELDAYYKQYFTDRAQVVSFSEKYQGEFAARQAKVESYDTQLSDLNGQIERNKATLEADQKELARLNADVEAYFSAGNNSAYIAAVRNYNAHVVNYNALIDTTQQRIAQYNTIVAERNAISTEEQQLQKALDSRPQAATGA